MYNKYTRLSVVYGFSYKSMEYEARPEFDMTENQHPYTTGEWANNEPFPCRVPLFESLDAVKQMAISKEYYIQPIFYCENLKAAITLFYRLESLETRQSMKYAVYPVTSSPAYSKRVRSTRLTLRDKNASSRKEPERWYKLDPISVKLNPWDTCERIIKFPPEQEGQPWVDYTAKVTDHDLGSYVTNGDLTNVYQDQGSLIIRGIIKTKDGKYAIIGRAYLEEWHEQTADNVIGYSPGAITLGEQSRAFTTHIGKSSTISLGEGITATLWKCSYRGNHRIPQTYPPQYATVENIYENFELTLNFEGRKKSPFF